jgi:RimJ/RimL family protein N-acetyltransferase
MAVHRGSKTRMTALLRRARAGDMQRVFEWRNDPFIVSRSSSGKTVALPEHERWFDRKISDPDCLFFIIESEGKPIGQVRLERETADQCVISIYLVESQTAKGRGLEAIRLAQEAAWQAWPVKRIVALVRSDNIPGQRVFAAGGFAADAGAPQIPSHLRFVAVRNG